MLDQKSVINDNPWHSAMNRNYQQKQDTVEFRK